MKAEPIGSWIKLAKGKKPDSLRSAPGTGLLPYLDIAAIERGMKRQWSDASDGRVVPKGTLVMVWDGARSGWAGITPFDGLLGSTLVAVDSPLDKRYLAAFFRMHFDEINTNHRGTGIPHVNPDFLYSLSIPIPPDAQQRALAALWESIVSRKTSAAGHLESARAAVERFRHAVLAAACSGRLTADWRAHRRFDSRSGTRSPSALSAAYHAGVDLPDGWEVKPVGDLFRIQNGRAFPSPEYRSEGVRLLRPGNLGPKGDVVWSPERTAHLPRRWASEFSEFILGEGELVMNLTAQSLKDEFLGRVCLKTDSEAALLNQRIARFVNLGAEDLRPYALLYFKSIYFRRFVNGLDSGTLIRHMHSKHVLDHLMLLPPPAERDEIVRRANRLLALEDRLESRIETAAVSLERTADAALAKAFRDEVSLNGSENDLGKQAAVSVQLAPHPSSSRRRRERTA